MLVDFSQVNLKEPPLLILKNVDGTPIQPLGYARNANAQLRYNDTSVLTFELPEYVDGKKTPHYDDVVGLKNIDWSPIGMFVLVNPVEHNDGIQRYKECTAYSLEYEFTYKTISIETGTYNFWNLKYVTLMKSGACGRQTAEKQAPLFLFSEKGRNPP